MKTRKIYMNDTEVLRILPHETDKSELEYITLTVGKGTNIVNINQNNVRELIEILEQVSKDYKL